MMKSDEKNRDCYVDKAKKQDGIRGEAPEKRSGRHERRRHMAAERNRRADGWMKKREIRPASE